MGNYFQKRKEGGWGSKVLFINECQDTKASLLVKPIKLELASQEINSMRKVLLLVCHHNSGKMLSLTCCGLLKKRVGAALFVQFSIVPTNGVSRLGDGLKLLLSHCVLTCPFASGGFVLCLVPC